MGDEGGRGKAILSEHGELQAEPEVTMPRRAQDNVRAEYWEEVCCSLLLSHETAPMSTIWPGGQTSRLDSPARRGCFELFLCFYLTASFSKVAAQGAGDSDVWIPYGSFEASDDWLEKSLASQLCRNTSFISQHEDRFGHFTFKTVVKHQSRMTSGSDDSDGVLVEFIWRQERAGCGAAAGESSGDRELLDVRMEGRSRMVGLSPQEDVSMTCLREQNSTAALHRIEILYMQFHSAGIFLAAVRLPR
eukprot:749626-Hanusia_phi.AAC.1